MLKYIYIVCFFMCVQAGAKANPPAPPCTDPDIPVLSANQDTLCAGDSTYIYVVGGNLNGADDWVWHTDSCNGPVIGYGIFCVVKPTVSSVYYVRGEGACVTEGGPCATKTITVNEVPAAAGAIGGNSVTCAGRMGMIYQVAAIPGATGYEWTLPSGFTLMTGANTNSITIDFSPTATSGSISVYGVNGCGNGSSASKSVTVRALPPVTITPDTATVCVDGTTMLFVNGGVTYNWSPATFLDAPVGDVVYCTPTAAGTYIYTVLGTDANGCSATDTAVVLADECTGMRPLKQHTIRVSPNPACTQLAISLPGDEADIHIEIFSASGQRVYRSKENAGVNHEVQIPLFLPNGMYYLKAYGSSWQGYSRFCVAGAGLK